MLSTMPLARICGRLPSFNCHARKARPPPSSLRRFLYCLQVSAVFPLPATPATPYFTSAHLYEQASMNDQPADASSKKEVFGHRGVGCSVVGGTSVVPENSLRAFELAHQQGLEGVELDTWLTKDDEVIVIHGGGSDAEGFIDETVVVPVAPDPTQKIRIESSTYEELKGAGFDRLKEPWSSWSVANAEALEGKDAEQQEKLYCESQIVYKDRNNEELKVPLLKEVLETFKDRLQFHVELKGTNPKLGEKVLEISKTFPKTVARISSFQWIPITNEGNQQVDLLGPLVQNEKGVPLALLYGTDVGSVHSVIDNLNKYQAQWAHIPEVINLSKEDEEKAIELFNAEKESDTLIQKVKALGFQTLKTQELKKPECETTKGESQLESEIARLWYLVKELKRVDKKVLVYGGRFTESPEILNIFIKVCEVDGLCPNNGKEAVQICDFS